MVFTAQGIHSLVMEVEKFDAFAQRKFGTKPGLFVESAKGALYIGVPMAVGRIVKVASSLRAVATTTAHSTRMGHRFIRFIKHESGSVSVKKSVQTPVRFNSSEIYGKMHELLQQTIKTAPITYDTDYFSIYIEGMTRELVTTIPKLQNQMFRLTIGKQSPEIVVMNTRNTVVLNM